MSEDKKDFWGAVENIRQAFKDIDAEYAKMAEECDPELKLAVTKWVMKHIVDHAREGGSYRYLIYDRLGFGPEAYAPLCSDGMTISNEFDLNMKEGVIEFLKNYDVEGAKKYMGYCDSAGCFVEASCGYPTKDGYRRSCVNHYNHYKNLRLDEEKDNAE
jgi:hypothetical protein